MLNYVPVANIVPNMVDIEKILLNDNCSIQNIYVNLQFVRHIVRDLVLSKLCLYFCR